MQESSDRPAWTSTVWQGMQNGFEAFKHRIVHKTHDSRIIRDYDWEAEANKVPSE